MKQRIVSAFGIGFLLLFFIASCNKKDTHTLTNKHIDSLSFYTHAIQKKNCSSKNRIKLANLGLAISTKTADSILFYQFKLKAQGQLNNYLIALNTSKAYLNLVNKITSKPHIAYANASLGYYYLKLQKKDSAFLYYNNAQKIYTQLNDTAMSTQCLLYISRLQADFGDYKSSEKSAIKALELIGDNFSPNKFCLLKKLASSSRNQFNHKEAIYWNNKALEVAKTNKDSSSIIQDNSLSYRDLKQYKKAISIFDSLLNHPINTIKTKARLIDNLAYTKWLENKNNSSVIPSLKKAAFIRKENKDWNGLNASYSHLSDVYVLIDLETSHEYAHKMLSIATRLQSPEDKLEALEKLIKTGESPSELKKHYNKYTQINDRLKIAKQQEQHHYAKLKYDTQKNRAENLKLSVANSQKDLEMEQKKTKDLYVYFSLGTIFLSIIAYSFYHRKKLAQEKREDIYKTETRISKKLHDEVANDMVHVMNNVQYSNQSKEVLLKDLQKIYLLTRNISHQNSRIKTGTHFNAELKNMLDGFSNPSTTILLRNMGTTSLKSIKKSHQREIFRVLQELMVNMQKHSQASIAVLSFEKKGAHYTISYADNGQGTDLNALKTTNGLSNMESRIKDINGTITFDSKVGKGFKSIIRFKK
ncbi:MAG: hypothetical protein COB98_07510 [Flavobacteriaceae bacterium]|nr:MAG: hypothetical protein COB98_07510 [Flavobacteriaceae bacterium]